MYTTVTVAASCSAKAEKKAAIASEDVTPAVMARLPYDAERDLIPLAPIGWTVMVMVTSNDFPAKNLQELVALLRANPGKYSYASSGTGGIGHLQTELFKSLSGTFITHIPYRGAGPAVLVGTGPGETATVAGA